MLALELEFCPYFVQKLGLHMFMRYVFTSFLSSIQQGIVSIKMLRLGMSYFVFLSCVFLY